MGTLVDGAVLLTPTVTDVQYDGPVVAVDPHAGRAGLPTLACNDLSALATLEVAAELGLDVPARLSVLGFDDIPESATAHPPLTTVQQPIRQMGHDALRMLLALIDGDELDRTSVTLDTTLVVPRSTAAPPQVPEQDRLAT